VWEGVVRRPLRDHFDIRAFGANAYTAMEAGAHVIEKHAHGGGSGGAQEELYLVLSGRASFTVDGTDLEASSGTMVFVEPDATRAAVALEPGTTVLVIGAPRDKPYDPPPWPAAAGMWRYRELIAAGDLNAALAYLAETLTRFPGNAGILYQRALCNVAAGRAQHAVEDLARSVRVDARLRRLARDDDGFTALRDDPTFARIVSDERDVG
jgi:Tetratricopeptide repeat